ncbi:MAG TPA: hypothetical protein VLG37_00385 [Candidatus Saccharimonadales bacterium]|nr:hypothetical protein [Candidatus Saccharimonadales bacterium]
MTETTSDSTGQVAPKEQAPVDQYWATIFNLIEGLPYSAGASERAGQVGLVEGADIIATATRLHEVLAPDVSHEPIDFVMSHFTPEGKKAGEFIQPAERPPFYDYAAQLIRQLAENCQPGEEQLFLNRASDIAGLTIVLAHPFEDANGRTARTLGYLIRNGYDGSEGQQSDLKAIGTNRPEGKGFRIISYLPVSVGKQFDPAQLLDVAASRHIPLSQEARYEQAARAVFQTPYRA